MGTSLALNQGQRILMFFNCILAVSGGGDEHGQGLAAFSCSKEGGGVLIPTGWASKSWRMAQPCGFLSLEGKEDSTHWDS